MRRFSHDGSFGGKAPAPRFRPISARDALAALFAFFAAAAVFGQVAQEHENDDDSATQPAIKVEEELTVTDTRLFDEPDPRRRVPAHVTVITRDEIERSGARTLQDLLSLEAGVVVFDPIGNDIQKSFDLRGFGGEAGPRVFLDGAPLNEPRNNSVSSAAPGAGLELVPLQAVDRIEITRGSVAPLAGAGSEAGVINLWTRRGAESGGAVSAAAGDFDTFEGRASLWHDFGAADLFVSGSAEETDGFRDNSGGDLDRYQGSLGWDLGPERRISLNVLRSGADLGSPGALTLAEIEADRDQAPFNQLDFIDEELGQATLQFATGLGRSASLSANLFARDREDEGLTTGRSAALFGGFASQSESEVVGSTLQLGHGHAAGSGTNRIVGGVEWLDGDNDAVGSFTLPSDPGTVDPFGLSSDNTAERETLGLYVHDTWQPAESWTIAVGARYDDDSVGYDERFPEAGNDARRDFDELSLRGGVTWSPAPAAAIYLSYGEAFLPPTVEQLFSFPLFGSNPGLDPEDSRSWEAGYRGGFDGFDLDAALFRVDSENEIVFDSDSPLGLFGANLNAGESRREGIELVLRGRPGRRARPFVTATFMDAELRSGENAGGQLPLTPEERITAGVDLDLTTGLILRAEGLHTGDQVMQNDDANQAQELDAYEVVNLRATWRPGDRRATASGGRARGLVVFAEARNVLDEDYATRGIFSSFVSEVFLTPAPGRRWLGGLGWEF